jgi:hypothetical protein
VRKKLHFVLEFVTINAGFRFTSAHNIVTQGRQAKVDNVNFVQNRLSGSAEDSAKHLCGSWEKMGIAV